MGCAASAVADDRRRSIDYVASQEELVLLAQLGDYKSETSNGSVVSEPGALRVYARLQQKVISARLANGINGDPNQFTPDEEALSHLHRVKLQLRIRRWLSKVLPPKQSEEAAACDWQTDDDGVRSESSSMYTGTQNYSFGSRRSSMDAMFDGDAAADSVEQTQNGGELRTSTGEIVIPQDDVSREQQQPAEDCASPGLTIPGAVNDEPSLAVNPTLSKPSREQAQLRGSLLLARGGRKVPVGVRGSIVDGGSAMGPTYLSAEALGLLSKHPKNGARGIGK
jgi:hypothetical protein